MPNQPQPTLSFWDALIFVTCKDKTSGKKPHESDTATSERAEPARKIEKRGESTPRWLPYTNVR
jgi:hypothetical protein